MCMCVDIGIKSMRYMCKVELVREGRRCFQSYNVDGMVDSMLTTSTTVGILIAFPHHDQAPLMDWIAERNREKARQQCSQHNVLL